MTSHPVFHSFLVGHTRFFFIRPKQELNIAISTEQLASDSFYHKHSLKKSSALLSLPIYVPFSYFIKCFICLFFVYTAKSTIHLGQFTRTVTNKARTIYNQMFIVKNVG